MFGIHHPRDAALVRFVNLRVVFEVLQCRHIREEGSAPPTL
jgi:hypothetical protein